MLLFTPETDITLFTGIKIHNFKKKILLLENLEKHKEILKEKVKEKSKRPICHKALFCSPFLHNIYYISYLYQCIPFRKL